MAITTGDIYRISCQYSTEKDCRGMDVISGTLKQHAKNLDEIERQCCTELECIDVAGFKRFRRKE